MRAGSDTCYGRAGDVDAQVVDTRFFIRRWRNR